MTDIRVRKFRCLDCPKRIICLDESTQQIPGVTLKYGRQYCLGGKKARIFRPKDPKVYPPPWCPMRKTPVEYRVYTYMNETVRYCRELLKRNGVPISPSGFEYALRAEGSAGLDPAAFQRVLKAQSPSEVLGVIVHMDDVIEIDDGLRPCFFHVTDRKTEVLPRFDKKAALGNLYEGPTVP